MQTKVLEKAALVFISAFLFGFTATKPQTPAPTVSPSTPESPVVKPTPIQIEPGCCEKLGFSYESEFFTKLTSYYPDASPLEGGFNDRKGRKLRTLQDFIAGKAEYVSVAMDLGIFPYGKAVCIPELETKYKKSPILFRVVDTGGAFYGKKLTRMDVCAANKKESLNSALNGEVKVFVCDEGEIK